MSDIYRFRAKIRFTKDSGLASWCKDQMAVRFSQTKYVNEGKKNQESPYNNIIIEISNIRFVRINTILHFVGFWI